MTTDSAVRMMKDAETAIIHVRVPKRPEDLHETPPVLAGDGAEQHRVI